jgi:hypothetical protein
MQESRLQINVSREAAAFFHGRDRILSFFDGRTLRLPAGGPATSASLPIIAI